MPFPAIKNECQVAKENIKKHIEKLRKQLHVVTREPDFTEDIVTRVIEKRIGELRKTQNKLMKIHEMDSRLPEVEEMLAKEMARKSKNLSTTTGKELEELEEDIARNCRTLRTLQMSNDARRKARIVSDNIERRYA